MTATSDPLSQTDHSRSSRRLRTSAVLPVRCLSLQDAARYVGVSATSFQTMIAAGEMPPPRVWRDTATNKVRRKLWDVRDLDDAIDNIPHEGENRPTGWEDV